MAREPWYESEDPKRHAWGFGRIMLVVFLVIVVLGLGTWGFKVATSDVKGAGDATIQINSGTNRVNSQEEFQKLYAAVVAADKNLDQAAKDKADHPGDSLWDASYSGMVKFCNSAAQQYNAASKMISKAKWKDTTLPYEIDGTDPTTDCKETTK